MFHKIFLNHDFAIIKSALVQPSIHANPYKILFAAYQKLLKEGESPQEDIDYFLGLNTSSITFYIWFTIFD
jgi:hypothetical protein